MTELHTHFSGSAVLQAPLGAKVPVIRPEEEKERFDEWRSSPFS
jgi:hypothetical protein